MSWYMSKEEYKASKEQYNLKNFYEAADGRVTIIQKFLVYTLGFLRQIALLSLIIVGFGHYCFNVEFLGETSPGTVWLILFLLAFACPFVWIIATIYSVLKGRFKKDDTREMLNVFDAVVNQNRDGLILIPFRRLSVWGALTYFICYLIHTFANISLPISESVFVDFGAGLTNWSIVYFFVMLIFYTWHFLAFMTHGDYNIFTWLVFAYWTDLQTFFGYFFDWRKTLDLSLGKRIVGIIIRLILIALFITGSVYLIK